MSKLKRNNSEFEQIASLIEEARSRAFHKVNEELVLLYLKVGNVISTKVSEKAWGDGTVDELANYIETSYPGLKGFNRRGLYRMKQFFETYTDKKFVSTLATQLKKTETETMPIVTTLLTQLHWSSHLHIISKTKSAEEKIFYLQSAIAEKWSVRDVERQLNSAIYERTALANKNLTATLPQLPQNLFKDPYIFEFLDLPEGHSEKDLEKALIKNLQKFILEVGKGFTYMGNQFRLQVGNKDYYTDLLFYHRDLQCLILFELKIQEFEPEFLGKLNFYLEALDKDVKRPFEKSSIGILLCKGKDTEVVEYAMARNISPALVADYETKLIPKYVLADKLHQLVEQLSKSDEL
ncbi:MAG: PDDEXK nuclease domain-containing protein [Bacteroidota bacterium]